MIPEIPIPLSFPDLVFSYQRSLDLEILEVSVSAAIKEGEGGS
jgi:hypothetical protein